MNLKLKPPLLVAAIALIITDGMAVLAQESTYQRCEPETDCTIGEYIFSDDGHTPITTDGFCQVTITSPEDAVIVNNANMDDKNDGWYYYTANIASPNGTYRSTLCCDSGADRQCENKTFVLGTSIDSLATKNDLAALVGQIWGYTGGRTLTALGNLASDVWNNTFAPTRRLTEKALDNGENLATETYVDTAKSDLLAAINNNATLIGNLNNISAADVWSYGSKNLDGTVEISSTSTKAIWNVAKAELAAAGSIGEQIATNLDAAVSSRSSLTAGDVWNDATRTLTDYATTSTALAVWNNAQRTLTDYGNNIAAGDVWNVLSSSLNSAGTIGNQLAANIDAKTSERASQTSVDSIRASQQKEWTVQLSKFGEIAKGDTYRARLWILDYESVPTDPFAAPLVTVYDAVRNKSAENVSMTRISAGIYEYTFAVANSAVQGTWETQVDVQIEAGKIVQANDYWNVAGSPAQIIINSVTDLTIPEVSANITLTNEGTTGYEYTYEWCVVSSQDNACGGSDDVFYSSAAKFVQPAEDWITNLNATVPNTGNYWFKVIVHFGTQQSGASQSFTAINQSGGGNGGGGGGGGSGGGTTLIQNISKALTSAGQAICNQNTFPCNIILQILARLDAGDKKTASIENKIVEIDRKLAAMLSAPITKAAPQRIYVQPAPKKTTVNKKAKFFVE